MRRSVFYLVCLLLLLSACGEEHSWTKEVTYQGMTYLVEQDPSSPMSGVIRVGDDTVKYTLSGGEGTAEMRLTYSNGSTYWQKQNSGGTFGFTQKGWSDDYAPQTQLKGEILWEVLNLTPEEQSGGVSPLWGALLALLGVWNAVWPRSAWYLSHGWRYQNAGPSDAALTVARVSGVAAILVGIFVVVSQIL